jgi:hypothetical protein
MVRPQSRRRNIMSESSNIDHSKRHPTHIAYVVREGNGKGRWSEIGAAWATKNGTGFVLQLHAIPIDGKIVLQPRDKE